MRCFIAAVVLALTLFITAPLTTLAASGDIVIGTTTFPWGQCTWYAALKRPDIGAWVQGYAWWWPNAATALNKPNGPQPHVGAVATFQPGIQYASLVTGHVAYVEQVAPNGVDFLISETNALCGLGCTDRRWVRAGAGVRFLY